MNLKKLKAALSILSVLIFMVVSTPVSMADDRVPLEDRTIEEIIEKYHEAPFRFDSGYVEYDIRPGKEYPYSAGKIKDEYLQEALNLVNFIRYIAGYPYEVTLDEKCINYAQHGVVLLAAIDQITHYPEKPDDMPEEFYNIASKGTASSNLGKGHSNIIQSILSCMRDADSSNIAKVGHRQWLLSRTLGKIGFGYCNGYSSTYVFDNSGKSVIYDFIAWPAQNMPIEFMVLYLPWSVNLGAAYDANSIDNAVVTLTRRRDNKVWQFKKDSVFKNDNGYFGVYNGGALGKCIIFCPDFDEEKPYLENDIFDVNISGITRTDGTEAEINYTVRLFMLYDPYKVKTGTEEGTYINEVEVSFFCHFPYVNIHIQLMDQSRRFTATDMINRLK